MNKEVSVADSRQNQIQTTLMSGV